MRFDKLAWYFSTTWSIMRDPIHGNHAEDFLTNLKMCAITAFSVSVILSINAWVSSTRSYMRTCICFLTRCIYASLRVFSVYDVLVCITMLRSILFEVRASISFYEKTCGKGFDIIEPIRVYIRDYWRCVLDAIVLWSTSVVISM